MCCLTRLTTSSFEIACPVKQLVNLTLHPPQVTAAAVEAALIADVLQGDRKAIAEFVLRYSDTIYAFLHRRIDDHAILEDICQEVFLVAWSKLASFRGDSSLKTWLCAIAKNKAVDFYRKRIRELPIDEERDNPVAPLAASEMVDFEQDLDRKLQEEKIRATLLTLPPGYRAVLRWRYWEGQSLQEIATEMGRTEKSIERLLARARNEFAEKWKGNQRAPFS